ncbi:MAG: TonB-dependent receptor [Leptospiraceae bacterium]|nr:TonB-dependent receptor [Leptospiraceae bacterium]MDW7975989.1 TonB-dependent receptor [Leptospiraceae bacterium]
MKTIKLTTLITIILVSYHLMGQERATIIVKGQKNQIIAEEVAERGYIEAGEIVKDIEGMHRIRRGKGSLDYVIRGFQRDNINVLPDGEKIYGACPNRMDPPSSLINLQDLGRIEVIKGPYDVKNQGGLGGTVYLESRKISTGLENYLKLQTGSFSENLVHFRSSYGSDAFKIAVSGNYNSYHPYFKEDKRSLASLYPDVDNPLYIARVSNPIAFNQIQQQLSGPIDLAGRKVFTEVLRYEFPYFFQEDFLQAIPSINRYEYDKRNVMGFRRGADLEMVISPIKNHEFEIKAGYQARDNDITPYLLMDMIWDDMKKVSVAYKQKKVSDVVETITYKIYGNEILHDMTDELRCSSHVVPPGAGTIDPSGCVANFLSREYGMRSWAQSGIRGLKVESEMNLMGKTSIGLDAYIRRWNIETTMRMPYPGHFLIEYPQQLPPINYAQIESLLKGMMGPMIEYNGLTGSIAMMNLRMTNPAVFLQRQIFYRTQATLPDTEAQNISIYLENEEKISKRLTQKFGIRYDQIQIKAKKDRRIVYNLYYPAYEPFAYFKYVEFNTEIPDLNQTFTVFDAEVYLPPKQPQRKYGEGSGYIKWDYEINPSLVTKLGLGYGVRFPDPQELYFAVIRMGRITAPDLVGNPTLKPTRNSQIDVGLETKSLNLKFDFDLFYSKLDNYIVVRNTPDHILGNITRDDPIYFAEINGMKFYQYINHLITYSIGIQRTNLNPANPIGSPLGNHIFGRFGRTFKQVDAVMYGGEARMIYSLTDNYILKGGLSYTRGINETEDTNLPEIPPLKVKLALEYLMNRFSVELEGVFADSQKLVDRNIGERRTAGWGIANLRFSYEINPDRRNLIKLNAGINNLFNRLYYEHLSYLRDLFASGLRIPEPGRSIYVNLEMKF